VFGALYEEAKTSQVRCQSPLKRKGTTMPPANALLRRAVFIPAAVAALIVLCLAIIVARSWKASRRAASDMHVIFSGQAPLIDQANKREQQRDAVLSKDLARISQEERAVTKPADLVKRLPAAFPALPHPLSISLAPPASGAPEPPAVITVPQTDLKPLFDRLEECRACQEKLATAEQDLEDERAKMSALMIERDAAVKAARGGGFWSRFRTGAKWFAIGGAMGAIAASSARR
jgi:cytochrome c-type biogenesis protein CcmH/NrfG